MFIIACRPELANLIVGPIPMPADLAYEFAVCFRLSGRMEKTKESPYPNYRQCKMQWEDKHLRDKFDMYILPGMSKAFTFSRNRVMIPTYGVEGLASRISVHDHRQMSKLLAPAVRG